MPKTESISDDALLAAATEFIREQLELDGVMVVCVRDGARNAAAVIRPGELAHTTRLQLVEALEAVLPQFEKDVHGEAS